MVEIRNLKKRYGERTVLDLPQLTIAQGETVALAGANGSGKTTLLRILAGLIKATAGTVETPEQKLYMPQQAYAFRGDLRRNIQLTRADRAEADRLLQQLGLDHLSEKKATSLSGGELQRLSLCRVLSQDCALLLLDEPTSACDAAGAALVVKAIEAYRAACGCTVVMSTHSPALALHAADRLIVLNGGNVEADGAPEAILANPETQWAKSFTAGWKL
ncbi:MAG: ABC transporter ATP-binding protein [Clostridia bacterium]|nr:ABC transporter ATP-binding protein [Clostridia bacterium]